MCRQVDERHTDTALAVLRKRHFSNVARFALAVARIRFASVARCHRGIRGIARIVRNGKRCGAVNEFLLLLPGGKKSRGILGNESASYKLIARDIGYFEKLKIIACACIPFPTFVYSFLRNENTRGGDRIFQRVKIPPSCPFSILFFSFLPRIERACGNFKGDNRFSL